MLPLLLVVLVALVSSAHMPSGLPPFWAVPFLSSLRPNFETNESQIVVGKGDTWKAYFTKMQGPTRKIPNSVAVDKPIDLHN